MQIMRKIFGGLRTGNSGLPVPDVGNIRFYSSLGNHGVLRSVHPVGPWEKTPWWMLRHRWKGETWRQVVWEFKVDNEIRGASTLDLTWRYATDTDFLTM